MAGSNEIKIVIGGDPSGFTQAARQATEATGRMRDSMKDAASVIPVFNNAAAKTSDTLKSKVTPGANQAAAALTNVGRVAQDLPFGFVGIQNNLNPMLESFQRLKVETGSSSAAFKALGSSLIGAGGIGLALSAVSAAILIYQNGIAGFNSHTKEAKEKADKLKEVLRDISVITGEAAASVEGQVSQVQALAVVVSNSNKPYQERKRALEELKDINKSYFGDLKIEDAATGKLTATVKEYTDALINSAIQKEFVGDIAKLAKAVVEGDQTIIKSRTKLAQAQAEVAKAQLRTKESFTEEQISSNANEASAALKKQTQAENELAIANAAVTDLLVQEALLRGNLNKAVEEGLKFKDLDTKGDKKEEDFLKKRLEALEKIQASTKDATARVGLQEAIFELQVKIAIRDQGKNQLSKQELDQSINGFKSELQKELDKQAIELELSPKAHFSEVVRADIPTKEIESMVAKATGLDKKIKIPTQFEIDFSLFGKQFADNAERIREQIKGVTDALFNGIVNGIENGSALLGEALAGILSGEGIGSALAKAAKGLLSIVGDILIAVGKELILTSTLVAALKKAITGLFGPGGEIAGLAVGALLIASGALLKNFQFDVPKLAEGGIATRATLGIFGEKGPEAILPLSKLPELFKSVGNLSTDRTQPIVLNGNLRVSGTDLSLLLERAQSRRSRLG